MVESVSACMGGACLHCACMQAAKDITYSIVRPTAFFKSVAGQIELVGDDTCYIYFTCVLAPIVSCLDPSHSYRSAST